MHIEKLEMLVRKVKNQDEEAFVELYNFSIPFILHVGETYGFGHALIEDVIQEVFIQVMRSIHTLKDEGSYIKWLMMITRSKCCNYLRNERHKSYEKVEEIYLGDEVVEVIEQMSMDQRIKEALDILEKEEQEVLIMKYLKELSEKEIARNLRLPLGTVKSRLYHARAHIKMNRCAFSA